MGNRKLDGAETFKIMAFECILGQEDRRPHPHAALSPADASGSSFLRVRDFYFPPIFAPSTAERSPDLCWAGEKNCQCTGFDLVNQPEAASRSGPQCRVLCARDDGRGESHPMGWR